MNRKSRSRFAPVARILVLSSFCWLSLSGFAQPVVAATLIDDNSQVDIDPTTDAGTYTWLVDGVDQLSRQWFWYRIGDGPEQSIDTVSAPVVLAPHPSILFLTYANSDINVEIRFTLDGGAAGSGASDMGEQISITNPGLEPLDLHFFQYTNFDVQGTALSDRGMFTNSNTVRQWEGAMRLTETVVTPSPNHREIDFYPNILNELNDGVATTLSDTPAIDDAIGPGDLSWAYQWDRVIAPGGTFQISKDKNLSAGVIPEPTSLLLLVLGGLGLAIARQRRFWK